MAGVVRAAALSRVAKAPGVEPGVSGKERRFQQNRQFGPGAFKPYKNQSPTRHFSPKSLPNYKGGNSPKVAPGPPLEHRRTTS